MLQIYYNMQLSKIDYIWFLLINPINIYQSLMSIKGVRRIRDSHKENLSLYLSQQYPKAIQKIKSNPFKLGRLDFPKHIQLLNSSRQIDIGAAENCISRRKVLPSFKNHQYQKYLNKQINLEEIHNPINYYKQDSTTDSVMKSFSSKQHRKQFQTARTSSILSNFPAEQETIQKPKMINKSNFSLQYVVGKGGFGKVWRVRQKKSGKIYAMKQMQKIKIINKKSVSSVMNQKQLLQKLQHPFIVNMKYAFQDLEHLYLVMDYVNCGDLRYHLGNRRKFTQIQSKFFIACMIVALQYMHVNRIIHRDMKPQNLVIDQQGYVKVTDMGVSRQYRINNNSDTSGTPGYMSPQVICKGEHSFTADFFAIGVMGYQFMFGKRPYVGRNRQQIRQQILAKQARIQEIPNGWSIQAVDFVNKLLQRKPQNRLGSGGIGEIKAHSWFKGFDWAGLRNKKLKSPYIPLTIQEDYKNYKQCISQDTIIQDEAEYRLLLKNKDTQQLFEGYQFYNEINKSIKLQKNNNWRQCYTQRVKKCAK